MNKGKLLCFCKRCDRKRFCTRASIPGFNFRYTCSKGHSWIIEGVTLERVEAAWKAVFTKEKLKSLFERDDAFYSKLSKR